jgi:D-alanyl-lipoteichoic acid acyltransferase DltB (MBOAT superfamily)
MLFTSFEFLVFCAVFFPLYFLLSSRLQIVFCLLASYGFYAWWEWRFAGLLVLCTAINYSAGLGLERTTDPTRRLSILALSSAVNLGILGVFKYFDFFSESARAPRLYGHVRLPFASQRGVAHRHFLFHLPVDELHHRHLSAAVRDRDRPPPLCSIRGVIS